ncbi:uncharacterized protein LOC118237448 isoform X2 [Anguilla anguilla]|uniref:uncharacterized protein LOC118237448 isoform X2 n=1 Tax=Anguilla anguilla TaxID=7936 RepID=UPI0015B0AA90|nr:uncharacterized protein LOC118237448 isoform X2 [Anguilla anguilla]
MAGCGSRHKVRQWPVSDISGHQHKTVFPDKCHTNEKEFVFVVGDSHLRSFADGVVNMPEGRLSFGFMATPGGDATALCLEISHLGDTPRTPDAVCLLAPGNNMTSSRTIEEAARAFGTLLSVALQHWPNKVFVVDFPIRHVHATLEYQLLLKQEYHRVAAKMGVRYFATNNVFQSSKRYIPRRCGYIITVLGVHSYACFSGT